MSKQKTKSTIKKYFNLDNIVDMGVDIALVVLDVLYSPILIVMRVVRWFLNEFVLGYLKKLIKFIETYKDFPDKGIEFKDVLGIIQEPKIFKELILNMSSSQIIKNAEAIISIDARGFIFGSAISLQASKPMIVARKPGKLPGEIIKQNYKLEYGVNSLSIQKLSLIHI